MTWRGLYACGNGWRRLQPGCFEVLDLPNCSRGSRSWGPGYPPHCILDAEDLGWTHTAGGASELLVAVDSLYAQVALPSSHLKSALHTGTPLADAIPLLAGV